MRRSFSSGVFAFQNVFIFDTQGPSFEFRQWDHAPTGTFAPVLVVQYANP